MQDDCFKIISLEKRGSLGVGRCRLLLTGSSYLWA